MSRFIFLSVFIILVFLVSLSLAGIPKLINYQGMLTDNSGTPLNGTYSLTFKIYNAESDGTKRWEETQSSVLVINGLFNVILGNVTPINLDFSEDYWLDITVGAEHMPSRLKFTSVGYAYRALKADTASFAVSAPTGGGWTDVGTSVRLITASDKVGIGTTSPDDDLHVANHIRVGEDPSYSTVYGELKHDGGGTGFVINANAGGGGWADMHFQTNGTTKMFIESGGNVGIGTTSPGEKLEVNGNLKVTGAYKGNIGPNNGAPFPRPAYDSGWRTINQNQQLVLTHNIGGSVDDYFIDLQQNEGATWGINTHYLGGDTHFDTYYGDWDGFWGVEYSYFGTSWCNLTSTTITVLRQPNDSFAAQIRLRIWVVK